MRTFILFLTSLLSAISPLLSGEFYQFEVGSITISSPKEGDVLQGVVEIRGRTDAEDYESAELHFSFHSDPTGTWFLISESFEPVEDGLLALWDTSNITDGTYSIRLTVNKRGDMRDSFRVDNLRVRNYSPIETDTPSPFIDVLESPTPENTQTPRPPTPTLLPQNPAELMQRDVWRSAYIGAILVGLIATVLFVVFTIRRNHFG